MPVISLSDPVPSDTLSTRRSLVPAAARLLRLDPSPSKDVAVTIPATISWFVANTPVAPVGPVGPSPPVGPVAPVAP